MCDLAVAAEVARFAVSGINVGLFCSTPAVGLARNLGRKAALEMLLTGDFHRRPGSPPGSVNPASSPPTPLDAEVERSPRPSWPSAVAVRLGKACSTGSWKMAGRGLRLRRRSHGLQT